MVLNCFPTDFLPVVTGEGGRELYHGEIKQCLYVLVNVADEYTSRCDNPERFTRSPMHIPAGNAYTETDHEHTSVKNKKKNEEYPIFKRWRCY